MLNNVMMTEELRPERQVSELKDHGEYCSLMSTVCWLKMRMLSPVTTS